MAKQGLARPQDKKMIAGVCAGLADHYGVSVRRLRLAFVLFGLFGAGEIAYVGLWIVIPKAR